MSVVSRLPALGGLRAMARGPAATTIVQRSMGGGPRTMNITASRWQWHKFKDLLHYYFMLGAIPCTAIAFAVNVFIGPAELAPIPEGYTPKHWEYHAHPISRFLARYVCSSHQMDYEKYLHYMYEENEMKEMRRIEAKVKDLMATRLDSQAHYYRPILTKYHKMVKEEYEKVTEKGF
ncbi:NADH dehydrogenase [ubiquinone] 1 beta subcomplex subunit 5, mitochondrial-like [Eriocheir sinensis]|uniref:NADH dehydrogenase [ubiquinone] 1 beta subcomplex subunit 5, mitochondrial-like n=1 Tax=Eriocheir sinensis TaxID=95602 RepID=UPI0021CA7777|nr:NADH dehydrogenase [ubiquinone] 1 beta subcomplex subunit 5, mitochondrial-like [Eriocheir sinensis]